MSKGALNDDWRDQSFGPLPAAVIEKCLGLKLKPGEVFFYSHAKKHTFDGRPERRVCLPYLQAAISDPTYVGQQPGYEADSFDLVYVTPNGLIVLVAMSMRLRKGIYPIKSVYPLKKDTLQRRLRVGTTTAT